MSQIINLSIDLSKVDKQLIKEVTLKSGKIAKYLNLTMYLNDEADKYGNHASLAHAQTEEQRNSKSQKIYVGNGKVVWSNDTNTPNNNQPNESKEDDLPF